MISGNIKTPNHTVILLPLLLLNVLLLNSVNADNLSSFSHKALLYQNGQGGVIHLKANTKLSNKLKVKRCANYPIKRDCDADEISYVRHTEFSQSLFSRDIFIDTTTPATIVVANCDTDDTTCFSQYQSQLGLSGRPSKTKVKLLSADINGDNVKDYLLILNRHVSKGRSYVILSPAIIDGVKQPLKINQVLDEGLFGRKLSELRKLSLKDVNNDGRADLLVRHYANRTTLVAYADANGRFFNQQAHIPTPGEAPNEFTDCAFPVNHPAGFENSRVMYSADCNTVYVSPPPVGHSRVVNIDKHFNLDFCPLVQQAGNNADAIITSIDLLAQRILTLAETLTSDATTSTLETQISAAQLQTNSALSVYQAAVRTQSSREDDLLFAEFNLEDCLLMGNLCDAEFNTVDTIKQQIAATRNTVENTLAAYMIALDTEESITLSLGQYRANILSTDPVYLQLQADYQALVILNNGAYRELTALQGAAVRFDYQLDINTHLLAYQQLNIDRGLTWKFYPIQSMELLTDLEGVRNLPGSSVLWMHSEDKNFNYTLFPDGSADINNRTIPQTNIALLDKSYIDVGLSLVGACQYFPNSKQTNTQLDFANLTAVAPVNMQYTYLTKVNRGYTVTYNLYKLAELFVDRALYLKIINKLPTASKPELAALLRALTDIDNTEMAEMLDSRFDRLWFDIRFHSESSEVSLSLLEQEQVRMEVKADLFRQLLQEVSLPYRKTPILQHSTYVINPAYPSKANDACWQRFGALCRFNRHRLNLTSQAIENFKLKNNKWYTKTVNDSQLVERTSGTTFTAASAQSSPPTVNGPIIGPNVTNNPQITIKDTAGNIIAAYDQTAFVTYEFDGLGRIIKERKHTDSPILPFWSESFDSMPSGLTDLPQNYMTTSTGELVIESQNSATNQWMEARGTRNYQLNQNIMFRFDVRTGAAVNGRYLVVGVDGDWSLPAYRRHAVQFYGDSAFVSYYDNGYKTQMLSLIDSNVEYIVEVMIDAQGTTLYLYPKGLNRDSGYSDRRNYSDWGQLNTFIEAQGAPGAEPAKMYIANISESISNSTAIAGVVVPETQQDSITEYFYDDDNRLTGFKNVNGAFVSYQYTPSGLLASQTLHYNKGLPTLWVQHFDRDWQGFWNFKPDFMKIARGQLQVNSVNQARWEWPAIIGKREYKQNEGLVFRSELKTGPTDDDRYLVIGLEGDDQTSSFRRHAAYFDGDSVFATHYNNGYQDTWLGLIDSNRSYVIEIIINPMGSTLYVYPKELDRTLGYQNVQAFTDWGLLHTFVEARGYPGADIATMNVNYISESRHEGELMGKYIVPVSPNDLTSPITQ